MYAVSKSGISVRSSENLSVLLLIKPTDPYIMNTKEKRGCQIGFSEATSSISLGIKEGHCTLFFVTVIVTVTVIMISAMFVF